MRQTRLWWLIATLFVLVLGFAPPAAAHVGAPYPVLLEEPVGPYLASALADPDVGTGTFYVMVTTLEGEPPATDTTVTLWVQPEDGHLPETEHLAEHQQTRYGERFVAKVPFDVEGPWQIRLAIEGEPGRGETAFSVRVTPSGTGWLATLGCLLPFLVLGALWLRGALRQRSAH